MSVQQIHEKLGAFAHAEHDTPQVHAVIEKRIAELRDLFGAHQKPLEVVDISGYFPSVLKRNKDKYTNWIRPNIP
jgi:hypothetical protein